MFTITHKLHVLNRFPMPTFCPYLWARESLEHKEPHTLRRPRLWCRNYGSNQCLNSGGTRGNAVPVRKLLPRLEGTLSLFTTHVPQSLPQGISTSGAFCSQFHLSVATAAAGCLPYANKNFPVSVSYFRLTMHLCMTISLTPLSKAVRVLL